MSKFAGEIPFVIGLNGIGKSNGSEGSNEKSNRECFAFPEKTFGSLDGDQKVRMYNFYDSQDEIVPPAFDDSIVFPYNEAWEYATLKTLSYTFPLGATIFGWVQAGRFFSLLPRSRYHIDTRTEARKLDYAGRQEYVYETNISKFTMLSHIHFYQDHVNPYHAAWNYADLVQAIFTAPSLFFISQLPNILFCASINGDPDFNWSNGFTPHHQLLRIHGVFIEAIKRIDSDLIRDNIVDFRRGSEE